MADEGSPEVPTMRMHRIMGLEMVQIWTIFGVRTPKFDDLGSKNDPFWVPFWGVWTTSAHPESMDLVVIPMGHNALAMPLWATNHRHRGIRVVRFWGSYPKP